MASRLNCFFTGKNSSPMSCINAVFAFDIIAPMLLLVLALMINSRSMLPMYFPGSCTSPSVLSSKSRLLVIFAPPSMAHWLNSVFSVATFLSFGSAFIAANTWRSVPVPSSCMDAATSSASNPSAAHASFCFFVALEPLLMFV